MNILNFFQRITLTSDQRNALEKLYDFLSSDERVFILKGYAGSGKTTLLKGIAEYLRSQNKNYQLMAPTGRAAKVINQKTGFKATTIHKGIYSFGDLHLVEIEDTDDPDNKGVFESFYYKYELFNNPNTFNSVLIVDEASMVSDTFSEGEFFRFGSGYLLRDLIQYSRIQEINTSGKIIFIGDPAQLPPINMNFSPALEADYIEEKYKVKVSQAEMKEVKRQDADNGILKSATKLRQCMTSGYFNDFDLRDNERDLFNISYSNYLETYKSINGQKIIITYKNKTALDLNVEIRKDRYGEDLPLQASDQVIISNNNYQKGIMNGEFAIVSKTSPNVISRTITLKNKGGIINPVKLTWRDVELIMPDDNNNTKYVKGYILENFLYGDNYLTHDEYRALYVDFLMRHPNLKKSSEEFKEAIVNDPFYRCILVKYGYAVTCHKAQGGEWPNALVFWDRGVKEGFNFYESKHDRSGKTNIDFHRWAYTAVTRSSSNLYCVNPPYFNSFSEMIYVDINVQQSFNELCGNKTTSEEIDFREVIPELERIGIVNESLSIQDHFIQRWYYLKKYYIDVIEWKRVSYEIQYVFKRDDKTAGFKYWINGNNHFKPNFLELPGKTNSAELFKEISDILEKSSQLIVNRNNVEGILTQIEFDVAIEEERPFLKNLYEMININLNEKMVISDIKHFPYKERYTIKSNNGECIMDFEYNKNGFFGRVLPLENKCTDTEILNNIKDTIVKLKE